MYISKEALGPFSLSTLRIVLHYIKFFMLTVCVTDVIKGYMYIDVINGYMYIVYRYNIYMYIGIFYNHLPTGYIII